MTTEPAPVRLIDDVETLRAVSDPLRLKILRELRRAIDRSAGIMSAKELAEALGEPQTKLYRHLKQLESQGLIVVAETRLVSGITEQRYRVAALRLEFDGHLLGQRATGDDNSELVAAAFDEFRDEYVGALRAGEVTMGSEQTPELSYRRPGLNRFEIQVPPTKAREFRDRLAALVDELLEFDGSTEGVPLRIFAAWYSPPPRPAPEPAS